MNIKVLDQDILWSIYKKHLYAFNKTRDRAIGLSSEWVATEEYIGYLMSSVSPYIQKLINADHEEAGSTRFYFKLLSCPVIDL